MTKAVLHAFEDYQKARITFVQTVAELSSSKQNVETLYSANVIPLLKPLLLDVVPSIQQSAALAIGRLAKFSSQLAESVADNDIIPQLTYSIQKQNRFFKKAACFVIQAVAQHSVTLAQKVVNSGALEPLVKCLDEFDPSIKEAAAHALGDIAKHNEDLAHQIVEARAIDSLILCLQEPELILKRVASSTLSNICKHTEQLSQPVAENGLDVITSYLNHNDTIIKRNACNLLTNISKHSDKLATLVLSKIVNPQKLLNCLRDKDEIVRRNAAMCVCEIVKKCPENAMAIYDANGAKVITDFVNITKDDGKLYGILTLAYMASFKEDMATQIINEGAISVLKECLEKDNDKIKCAVCFALNHIGRHSPNHANEISKFGILETILFFYMDPNSSDDLKNKAKKSLNEIICKCSNLNALEPLLHIAKKKVLFNVLNQFAIYLKDNQPELSNFARNGGLRQVLSLRAKIKEELLHWTARQDQSEESIENQNKESLQKMAEEELKKTVTNFDENKNDKKNVKQSKGKKKEEIKEEKQEVKIIKNNEDVKQNQPILELKSRVAQPLLQISDQIVSYYPKEIVNFYSPEYAKLLLDKIGIEDSKSQEKSSDEDNEKLEDNLPQTNIKKK